MDAGKLRAVLRDFREAAVVKANYSAQHAHMTKIFRLLNGTKRDAPQPLLREVARLLTELLNAADKLHKCIRTMLRVKQKEVAEGQGGKEGKKASAKEMKVKFQILGEHLNLRKKMREAKGSIEVIAGLAADPTPGHGTPSDTPLMTWHR